MSVTAIPRPEYSGVEVRRTASMFLMTRIERPDPLLGAILVPKNAIPVVRLLISVKAYQDTEFVLCQEVDLLVRQQCSIRCNGEADARGELACLFLGKEHDLLEQIKLQERLSPVESNACSFGPVVYERRDSLPRGLERHW